MRETHILQIELPGHLQVPREEVSEHDNIRQYCYERARKILPGEIRLECLQDEDGGWLVNVFELASMPEAV